MISKIRMKTISKTIPLRVHNINKEEIADKIQMMRITNTKIFKNKFKLPQPIKKKDFSVMMK